MTRAYLKRRIFPKPKCKQTGRAATRLNLEGLEDRCLLSTSATFVKQDTTTQGNWIGTYGSQGYDVIDNASSLPSYATVTPAGESNWTWAASSTDSRALQDAGGSGRIAACWYSNASSGFTVDMNLTDGQTHNLELYFVDWDSTTRAEQVQISNASTGAVLDTEKVTSFNKGEYLQWAASGNLLITITNTGSPNAVLSGLFLDPVAAAAPEPADAGFEQPSAGPAGAWGSFVYDPTGTAWSFTGSAGVSANGSGFTSGNPPAPEGAQVGVVQGTGSVSQSITGWAAGSYVITFDAAQRGNVRSNQNFEVLVDGTVVSTFTPSGASYQAFSTAAFTVGAGSHTITFQGLDSAGGDNTALIDAVALTQAGAPAISDGGFEQPSAGSAGVWGSFVYDPSGMAWSFASGAGVAANGSGFTSGNPSAPEGTQVGFLQGTGSFSQSVAGWAGGSYVITFDAAQRGNDGSHQNFEVLVDGTVVSTFTPSGTSYQAYSTAAFTVGAGSHTITFQGMDSAGGDNTALVDAVLGVSSSGPPQTTPPTVTAESPATGATGVAVSSTATATFSEAVQASTINFTLTPNGGSPVAASVIYNSSNYTATLTPSSALAYNTTYTVTVSGAQNSSGVAMTSPFSWSFTTDSPTTAPIVTAETPSSSATNVAVSSTATATFNEAVQASTINFTLTPSGGSPVAATITYNSANYTATLTPNSALAYSTTYTATVSGAKSSAGVTMTAPFTWTFTTTAASSALYASSETPMPATLNVALSTAPTVTFNQPVQSNSIVFTLTNEFGSAVSGTVSYNSSTNTATFTPSAALPASTTYTATVSGAKNSAGTAMTAPAVWEFITDPGPATVKTETPSSGATAVGTAATITAGFSEPVQAGTITFTLTPSGGSPIAATVTYSPATFTATLTPSSPLSASTTYTASLSGAQDLAGDSMATSTWSFTTGAPSATAATFLEQDTTTQGNWIGAYGSRGDEVIGNATSLPSYATVTPSGQTSYTWAANSTDPRALEYASGAGRIAAAWYSTSSFTVDVNLTDGQTHNLELYFVDWDSSSRAEQVQISNASTGAVLSTEQVASFNSGEYLDWAVSGNLLITISRTGGANAVLNGLFLDPQTTGPTVIAESPAAGTIGATTIPAVTATFSEPVQPSTIKFTLTTSSGTPVPWTIAYNNLTNMAAFTPNAILAYSTTYTATVSGAQNASGTAMPAPISWSFTTAAAPGFAPNASTGEYIQTDLNTIPNYGYNPTDVSVANGSWSSGATWSTGQVPGAGAIVSIASGTTVTYDANSTTVLGAITIQPGGTLQFATNVNTEVIAADYLVLPGGTLDVGTQANPIAPNVTAIIETANQTINTTFDPSQYGDSLIGLGNITIFGATKTPFMQLAVAPQAGATTLYLAQPVNGWQAGDQVYIPDTRQLDYFDNPASGAYVPESETATIASISPNGLVVTLTSALQYSHLGQTDSKGNLTFLPQVVDETRNVVIASQSSTGDRGIVMFLQRANVNINSASFLGLGRTIDSAFDNTTFNSSGQVTHIGTNQQDRTPVQFLNLWGPTTPQTDGYQYTLADSVVHCIMENQDHVWGIEVNNSSYGLIQGNFVDNWYGAGIALVTAAEVDNMIQGNFVTEISGTGNRDTTGLDGTAYWSPTPDDSFVDNVATDINPSGTYSYGFDINAEYVGAGGYGSVQIPAFQGADPTYSSQANSMNVYATPLLLFSGNETYGATPDGLELWWLGTFGDSTQGKAGVVQNFYVWNQFQWGYFGYQTNDLTIDGFFDRDNPNLNDGESLGMWFADYQQSGLVITNADMQGQINGFEGPAKAIGETLVENSFFSDSVDVSDETTGCVSGAAGLPNKSLVLQNDSFSAPSGFSLNAISMNYWPPGGVTGNLQCNLTTLDQVFAYNYDRTSGDNFQVYYTQQAASSIMPETGSDLGLIASPVSGLTNQQNWSTYGIATAGAVAPSNATTMTGIDGLVVAISPVGPSAIIGQPPSAPSGSTASVGQETTTNIMPHETTTNIMPQTSGPLAQVQNGALSSNGFSSTSVPAASTSATNKSTGKVVTSKSATGDLVAGPLVLTVPRRRNQVEQSAANSGWSPWTSWNT